MRRMVTGDQDGFRIFSACHWLSMSRNLIKHALAEAVIGICLIATSGAQSGNAQPQQTPPPDQKQDQNVPDAPSAVQPPEPVPEPAAEEPASQEPAPAEPATTEPPPQEPPP